MFAPHTELGMLQGYYHYQVMRGLCKVRGGGPHICLPASKGLGFHVHTIYFKDEGFVRILSASGFSPQLAKWGNIASVTRNCLSSSRILFCHICLAIFGIGSPGWLSTSSLLPLIIQIHCHWDGRCARKLSTTGAWGIHYFSMEVSGLIPQPSHHTIL